MCDRSTVRPPIDLIRSPGIRSPADLGMSSDKSGLIQRLALGTDTSLLRPARFFVSWSGVLVLAYQGFSAPLESLKRSLNSIESLPKENPGSRYLAHPGGQVSDGGSASMRTTI